MHDTSTPPPLHSTPALLADLRRWSAELGFARLGVASIDLARDEAHFLDWLRAGFNGEMELHVAPRPEAHAAGGAAARNGQLHQRAHGLLARRSRRCGCDAGRSAAWLTFRATRWDATITRCMRSRLQKLCDRIEQAIGPFGYRVFTDSAPVLEKALARNAGLGLDRQAHQPDRSRRRFVFFPRRDLFGS